MLFRSQLINDIKNNVDNVPWFDENGESNFTELLKDDSGTRNENGIAVPADSITIATDEYGDAVIVRMPDGSWMQYDSDGNSNPWTDKERQELIKDIKTNVDNVPWFDENGNSDFVELLKDGNGSGEPPTPPSGGGGGGDTPGGGFTNYVIDLAQDDTDLGKDLEEKLDSDAQDAGIELMDQIYDDASSRYELSQDIIDNKPEGMSNDEFVRDAVSTMREQLSDIADAADRKSTRLNSSHIPLSRMPSSA